MPGLLRCHVRSQSRHRVHLEGNEFVGVVPLAVHVALGSWNWTVRLLGIESNRDGVLLWDSNGLGGHGLSLQSSSGGLITGGNGLSLAAGWLTGTVVCGSTVMLWFLLVVMDSLHVIEEIIPPRKAMARDAAFTARVEAQVWALAVAVHAMSLSFVPQQACRGRELLLGAGLHLATEGLQMGVDEFAIAHMVSTDRLHSSTRA